MSKTNPFKRKADANNDISLSTAKKADDQITEQPLEQVSINIATSEIKNYNEDEIEDQVIDEIPAVDAYALPEDTQQDIQIEVGQDLPL